MLSSEMLSSILSIATGVVSIGIGFLFSALWRKLRIRRHYSLFGRIFSKYESIQIVLSSVEIARFNFMKEDSNLSHESPPNVLFTPLAEGRAVALLSDVVRNLNRSIAVKLVGPERYDPLIPAIVIGGPSVNRLTNKILRQEFREFTIDYPKATRAHFKGIDFITELDPSNGNVIRDHGFIFSTRTKGRAEQIVVCGVLAFGTAMAVEKLVTISMRSDAGKIFFSSDKSFIAITGYVDGLEIKDCSIIASIKLH